jgi:hypothetical protein
MPLVNIDSVHTRTLQLLAALEPPAGIELLSYKRNRMVAISRLAGGKYMVREKGYVDQELAVEEKELSRLLKTLIKREFPRSRKVRLQKFADPAELARQRNKI